MNLSGHPETLIPAHPRNQNAVTHGVHSERRIEARAAEIRAELTMSLGATTALQGLAVQEAARCMAVLEAIDRALDDKGVVDKAGKPRYLLNNRSRISRQLEHWLGKIDAFKPETPSAPSAIPSGGGDFADYVRALQAIALGQDPEATPRDRIAANRELLKLGVRGTSGYIEGPSPDDPELRRRLALRQRADLVKSLEASEKRGST